MIDPSHRAAAVRPSLLFLFFFFGLPGFQLGFHRARPSVEIPARFFICLFFLAYLGVCVKWEGISMDRVSIDQLFFCHSIFVCESLVVLSIGLVCFFVFFV